LLGVIALFVVGFLLVQLTLSLRASIDFTEHELDSIRRVPKVLKVVELTQQHRGLSSGVLNGNEELRPRLQKKTEELVVAMKAADEAIVADATPTAHRRWSEVRSGWEALRSGGLQMAPRDNLQLPIPGSSAPFVLALHDLGDDGNLTLDPSADTYYLIDNTLRRVPDVSERLGRLRAMGTGVLAAKAAGRPTALSTSAPSLAS
jgi:methyl-accepting chemotaxis protein